MYAKGAHYIGVFMDGTASFLFNEFNNFYNVCHFSKASDFGRVTGKQLPILSNYQSPPTQ